MPLKLMCKQFAAYPSRLLLQLLLVSSKSFETRKSKNFFSFTADTDSCRFLLYAKRETEIDNSSFAYRGIVYVATAAHSKGMTLRQIYLHNVLKFLTICLILSNTISIVEPTPSLDTGWCYLTAGMMASIIGSVNGKDGKRDKGATEWAFQGVVGNVKDKLNQFLGDLANNRNVEAAKETIWDNILDLQQPGIDNAEGVPGSWTWENFLQFMQNKMPAGETGDNEKTGAETFGSDIPPECGMTVPEMIRHAGYICEIHKVETNDGYVLELHRIPFPRNFHENSENYQDLSKKRPIVFLQHGILADSSCWVANGVGRSLAFLLADAGYDVWLGNVRGSTYSRAHAFLNPDVDEKYWQFSWQHMAQSDLPAMVNRALRESGQPNLYYIGHSQGTLIAFARLAEDFNFNKKIRMMFALGPVSTLADITSPLRSLVPLSKPVHMGMSMLGGLEILPKKAISKWISAKLHNLHQAGNDSLIYHGQNLMMYMCGVNPRSYFQDRLPVYLSHTPAGTSLQNLIHMSQLVESGKMQKWDFWSVKKNQEVYGQETPPEYDVSLIEAPIALFVGSEDQLADPVDSRRLSLKLKSLVRYRLLDGWDHLDFLWGKESVDTLYKEILELIKESERSKHPARTRLSHQTDDEL